MNVIVPPIKCQGIKTKLVPRIKESLPAAIEGTWIEPFCGSCVVALNVKPRRAILADTNQHIIAFYRAIQAGTINPQGVKDYLEREGANLQRMGERYYYEVRERFNEQANPLDFVFLNRACFNGVMRFNSSGRFNVPFCHKPGRFSQAYITKIVNQVRAFIAVVHGRDWQFEVADFRETLLRTRQGDFVYVDPPYAGRHVDYFNSWDDDEADLVRALKGLPCNFLLSTWHGNRYRQNAAVQANWATPDFTAAIFEHFYHVGATEKLRNAMTEALIANYPLPAVRSSARQRAEFAEAAVEQYALWVGE